MKSIIETIGFILIMALLMFFIFHQEDEEIRYKEINNRNDSVIISEKAIIGYQKYLIKIQDSIRCKQKQDHSSNR